MTGAKTMDGASKLVERCLELESQLSLWMAANQAKAERIEELEQLCSRLQQRVARLGRRFGDQRISRLQQIHHAR